ncbi:glycosyltransferase family 39 protein [Roseiconus lacunae]|uniref:ArnT family glycosyltransferase n=1 Tax=Roseiconus lacunae TaxID=2605694 RepID=UPI003084BA56|nr:glycosyltransferase family 39 protein [Stieleria sp. HD01]
MSKRDPPTSHRPARATNATIVLILAAAFAIRLWSLSIVDPPRLIGDEVDHFHGALQFAESEPVTVLPKRPPFYIWFAGSVIAIAGETPFHIRLAQVLIDCLTTLGVFVLCRQIFRHSQSADRTSVFAMGMYAIYPEFIAYSHYLWTETVFLCTLVFGFIALLKLYSEAMARTAVLAGLVWGISALLKPYQVYIFPCLLTCNVLCSDHRGKYRQAQLAILAMAIAATTVFPACCGHAKGWVLISSQGERTLESGTNYYPPPQFDFSYSRSFPESVKRKIGRKESIIAFLAGNPSLAFNRSLLKIGDFFAPNSYLIRHLYMGYYGDPLAMKRDVRLAIVITCMTSIIGFLLFGVLGFTAEFPALSELRSTVPGKLFFWHAVVYSILTILMVILAVSMSRYRLPLMVFCVVFTARWAAMIRLRPIAKRSGVQWGSLAIGFGVTLGAAFFRSSTILQAAW